MLPDGRGESCQHGNTSDACIQACCDSAECTAWQFLASAAAGSQCYAGFVGTGRGRGVGTHGYVGGTSQNVPLPPSPLIPPPAPAPQLYVCCGASFKCALGQPNGCRPVTATQVRGHTDG